MIKFFIIIINFIFSVIFENYIEIKKDFHLFIFISTDW